MIWSSSDDNRVLKRCSHGIFIFDVATTPACMGYLVKEICVNIFESPSTCLRHYEEADRCIENRQAAKEKVWSTVGICEENRSDQDNTEVSRLRAHQHIAKKRETSSTDPISTLSQACRSCSRSRRLDLARIRPYAHAPGNAVAHDKDIYSDDDDPPSCSRMQMDCTRGI